MRSALKTELLPELRRRGFSGKLPHFRRITESTISLLPIQVNKYGGSFAVEIGRAPASDHAPFPGKLVPATDLSAWDLALNQRARFWPRGRREEEWFSYRDFADGLEFASRARELVRSAVALLDQAEAWWAGASEQPNVF
jgi:hypothetical protein